MIPLFKVAMSERIKWVLPGVLESGYIGQGEKVEEFEKELKKYINNPYTLVLNSCTSALSLAYYLLDIKEDDEIITTPVTCVATNIPLLHTKVKIVWADVNKYGLININDIKKKITKKTKAIVCVDFTGIPCDLDELMKLNITIIEDSAQAIGAIYKEKLIGSIADITCFSFQAIKSLTTGDGGAITFKNKYLYERAKKLRWFGIDREESIDTIGDWKGSRWNCPIDEAGFKFHMNNISATIGIENLKELNKNLYYSDLNANYYSQELKNIKGVELVELSYKNNPSNWVYLLLVERRDELAKKLKSKDIDCSMLHLDNRFYKCFPKSKEELSGVDNFYKKELCIPCGWWLSEDNIQYIVETIKEFYNG